MIDRKPVIRSRSATAEYAGRAIVARTVATARAAGITVNAIELRSDGSIRVSQTIDGDASAAVSEFDRWNAAGLL